MNIEVRGESVVIRGYVNAVERYSKPITSPLGGVLKTFIEKIRAGVFKTALKRNDNVKVLLNHDKEREVANTKDGTAKLTEDNIGLRAEVTITDKEVVEKAKNNKLAGWSFGFYANSEEIGQEGEVETRTITDLDLVEVSILDDSKRPAYNGTSIETRDDGGTFMEIRETLADIEKEAKEKHKEVSEKSNTDFQYEMDAHEKIDVEAKEKKMELFATLVATKVVGMLNPEPVEAREEKKEEKETEVVAKNATTTEEERTIDYSAFEERLSKLKN